MHAFRKSIMSLPALLPPLPPLLHLTATLTQQQQLLLQKMSVSAFANRFEYGGSNVKTRRL
jgi:hypothetical protein